MYTLVYHIEYNQSEKGHQWLEIVVVEYSFAVYILDIKKNENYLQNHDHNKNNEDHKLYDLH